MWNRNAVESPDSAQPKPPQAGSCSSVPFRDCSAARKVPAPVGAAARLGETIAVPGEEAGVPGAAVEPAGVAAAVPVAEEAAELVEELQAVNRTATHARDAQDATCRDLRALLAWLPPAAGVISMVSNPSINE